MPVANWWAGASVFFALASATGCGLMALLVVRRMNAKLDELARRLAVQGR
jgi:hypothetical protein